MLKWIIPEEWPSILLTSILASLLCFTILARKFKNLPPGPWGLPLVGYAPFLTDAPHEKLRKEAETYGDVMSINMNGNTLIHLNSYDAIREAFVDKKNEFAGRPKHFSLFRWFSKGLGITTMDGDIWEEHRRFALHTMRDFGFAKLSMESRILEIADNFLQTLKDTKCQPYDVSGDLSHISTSVISSLVFDKYFEQNDPEYLALRKGIVTFYQCMKGAIVLCDSPFMRYFPKFLFSKYNTLSSARQILFDYCDKLIHEHEITFDPALHRDYIDVYLNERITAEKEGRLKESTFTMDRLKSNILNLYMAGSETTSTQLYWALKLLMTHSEVQKRVQDELNDVIGHERKPSILDRAQLPYTEAVILEIQRFSAIIGLIPPHCNPEKSEIKGFKIPKNSLVVANNWAVTRDNRLYVEPEKFNPSRFLGPDGKVINRHLLLTFSLGKRACPAESLAKMEIFLILTTILQKFTIQSPDDDHTAPFQSSVNVTRKLIPYKICAKPRFQ